MVILVSLFPIKSSVDKLGFSFSFILWKMCSDKLHVYILTMFCGRQN